MIFENFWNFKNVSEICPTLKCCNFFAIGPILKILDVPESSGPLLSHCRIYFSGSPSGQPLAKCQTRCRWAWVLRDVLWVWIRFRRILVFCRWESLQKSPDISKIKNIVIRRFQYVFVMCLLRGTRYTSTRLRLGGLCTKSYPTLTSLLG